MFKLNGIIFIIILFESSLLSQVTNETPIGINKYSKPAKQRKSVNFSLGFYAHIFLNQSGVGEMEGDFNSYLTYNKFKRKLCWGIGFKPQITQKKHMYSFHIGYLNKIFHYYIIHTFLTDTHKEYKERTYHYLCPGFSYGYGFKINEYLSFIGELGVTDRILFEKSREGSVDIINQFFIYPNLSFKFKSFGVYWRLNIDISQVDRGESETMSNVLGLFYNLNLPK